jgi:deoxyribonuclease-1
MGVLFVNVNAKSPAFKSHPPGNFLKSKWLLREKVFRTKQDRIDYYCGCRYRPNNTIIKNSCSFRAKHRTRRSDRIEWEHVVPAYMLGKDLPCWKRGGRKYCRRVSHKFRVMESDLHNLVPVIGTLNQYRSNYLYDNVRGEKRYFGGCDFEIFNRRVEVPNRTRGDIARRFLYITKKYRIKAPSSVLSTMRAWHRRDPVTLHEKTLDKRIKMLQGDSNPLVSGHR